MSKKKLTFLRRPRKSFLKDAASNYAFFWDCSLNFRGCVAQELTNKIPLPIGWSRECGEAEISEKNAVLHDIGKG